MISIVFETNIPLKSKVQTNLVSLNHKYFKSNHLYLNRSFYNTDCFKAALQ